MKAVLKAEKKALKEFEKNYHEQQQRHYRLQQTGREKNLIVPDGKDAQTTRRANSFSKDNVRKRMRKGQQKARRQRDGRAIPWWRRLLLRRSWGKKPK